MSDPKMGNKVLFIEIRDKDISSLLNGLREIFSHKKFNTGIHITIKGPQKTFRKKSIDKFRKENEPILIYDTGMIINEETYIVYMKVKFENLNGYMWRKPDYSDEYNPHITLYKGLDKHLASAVLDFLKKENISLVCSKYDIVIHTLRQLSLFSPACDFKPSDFQNLIDQGRIKSDIFSRAKKMVEKAKKL